MKSRNKSQEKGKSHTQRESSTPKKNKKANYTQGDKIEEDFEEMLPTLSLKKPKNSYNFYIMEMMEKDKNVKTITDATKVYSKKWGKLSDSEKKQYEKQAEEDKERYIQHLDLVRKHILEKPIKEG